MALRDIPASEIAEWLDAWPARGGRSQGKTHATEFAASSLSGNVGSAIILDEWGSIEDAYITYPVEPVATYEDARFPLAKTEVWKRVLDKNDPRNPNPAAGSHTLYVVIANGKETVPMSLAQAKMKAHQTHLKAVAALEAAEVETFAEEITRPGYGVF